jgi:hypothetical protein
MSEEDIRKNKRMKIINEIIKTKENKKILISDIRKLFNIYILIDYNDSIFKKGKENTQIRKNLLKEFQDEYLLYPKKKYSKIF